MTRVLCVDFGSTFTKAALVDTDDGTLVATASHPTTIAHRRPGRLPRDPGNPCGRTGRRGAGLLQRRWWPAPGRGRLRAGGDRRGRPPGRTVRRRPGRARGRRRARRRPGSQRAARAAGRTSSCWSAARTAATRTCCATTPAGSGIGRLGARWCWPATPRPPTRPRRADLARPHGHRSPPTCCPGSACSTPSRPAPRSARSSSGTSSAARGCPRGARSPTWCAPPRPTSCWPGSACWRTAAPASRVPATCIVVDVGGATTDVYSALAPEGEDATLHKEVVATMWHARTVEGDLGMRWNATGVVAAARAEHLPVDDALAEYAAAGAGRPGLPARPSVAGVDGTTSAWPQLGGDRGAAPARPAGQPRGVPAPVARRGAGGRVRRGAAAPRRRGPHAGCSPRRSATTAVAGGCPSTRGSRWTTATCCSPPACWPGSAPAAAATPGRAGAARRAATGAVGQDGRVSQRSDRTTTPSRSGCARPPPGPGGCSWSRLALYVLLRLLSLFIVLVAPVLIALLLVALVRPLTDLLARVMPRGVGALLTLLAVLGGGGRAGHPGQHPGGQRLPRAAAAGRGRRPGGAALAGRARRCG